ncbi:unnamed protein product [Coccothraustes coccothraustes]
MAAEQEAAGRRHVGPRCGGEGAGSAAGARGVREQRCVFRQGQQECGFPASVVPGEPPSLPWRFNEDFGENPTELACPWHSGSRLERARPTRLLGSEHGQICRLISPSFRGLLTEMEVPVVMLSRWWLEPDPNLGRTNCHLWLASAPRECELLPMPTARLLLPAPVTFFLI